MNAMIVFVEFVKLVNCSPIHHCDSPNQQVCGDLSISK